MDTGTLPTTKTTYPNGLRVLCEPRVSRRFSKKRGYFTATVRSYYATTAAGKLLGRITTGGSGRPGSFNGRTVRGYRRWLSKVREWSAE